MKLRNIILAALASVALFASCEKEPEVLPVDPDKTEKISVADFIAKADPQKPYVLSGIIEKLAKGDRYWGVDFNDGTGSISAAFPANWEEYKDQLEIGGKITVKGAYEFYQKIENGVVVREAHQVKKALILKYEDGGPIVIPDAPVITVAEFIQKADVKTVYRLTGKVTDKADGESYWGVDLTEGAATVSAAFPINWKEWKDRIVIGGTITVQGVYEKYTNKRGEEIDQVKSALIVNFVPGEGGGETPGPETPVEKPTTFTTATVAEFNAASVDKTTWYKLTGKIRSIASSQYGNVYLEDATGTVYIYGVTSDFVAGNNDQSFGSLGLKVGDELTVATLRAEFEKKPQGGGKQPAFYISHTPGEGGEVKPDGPATAPFTSSVSWAVSTDSKNDPTPSYDDKVTVNGDAAEFPALKLGVGSKWGKSTLTIPSGTKKLGFYACAWKGTSASLKFGNGTVVDGVRANVGATQSSPYQLTELTALDYFVIDLKGDEGTLTVETVEPMGTRAVIFGVNPVK